MFTGAAIARPKIAAIAIELTGICNQKCGYCYNEWRQGGGKDVSHGQAEKLLLRVDRLLDAFEIDHVTLTGGEPLASPVFFQVLEKFSAAGVGVQIISNGGLVTTDLAKRLAQTPLRFIQVTLNGSSASLHEAHVGEGHFARTLAGLETLRAHGLPVFGCIVVTRKNAADVGNIIQLWRSFGVRTLALSRFSPAGFAANQVASLLPGRDDLLTAFELAAPFARDGMRIQCTMPVPPCAVEVERFPELSFGSCAIGTPAQEFALSPDGKLRNCTLHKTALGGIQDILDIPDLTVLLQSPELTQYRRTTPEFCHGCSHEKTCAGGCGAAAEWVLGHARKFVDPFVWQHVDDAFAQRLTQTDEQGRRHLATVC